MKNPDDQDIDPDDIFEELAPTEPESIDARIRAGDEVDTDELQYSDFADVDEQEFCDTEDNFRDYLEEKKPKPPMPPEQP